MLIMLTYVSGTEASRFFLTGTVKISRRREAPRPGPNVFCKESLKYKHKVRDGRTFYLNVCWGKLAPMGPVGPRLVFLSSGSGERCPSSWRELAARSKAPPPLSAGLRPRFPALQA